MMPFQTEFEFTLPVGYTDPDGNLHRDGIMRLATATDEILPMQDSRVIKNPGYLRILVLSRVVRKLGTLLVVNDQVISGLLARDLVFLEAMFERLNGVEDLSLKVLCPQCGCQHDVPLNFTRKT